MDIKDTRTLENHFADLAARAERTGYPQFTDFLDTAEQDVLTRMQKKFTPVRVALSGGYEGAERRIASFCPSFMQDEEVYYPYVCLKIGLADSRFLKKKPQHRDYLGAVLGCGIERKMTGDILVVEDGAVIFLMEEMEGFLTESLTGVGASDVKIEPFTGDPDQLGGEGKEVVISVASLRLDAVLAHGFGASRGDAADWIRQGRVQINHRPCTKADTVIAEGQILTVRGRGRLKIGEQKGVSKSGRIQITARRFA